MRKQSSLKTSLNFVVASKNTNDGMTETLYLLKSPANARHLKKSIAEYLNRKRIKYL
jgi:PHD/YefM family antitoxin component YafN of YafNO toxin-antitoxin module